MTRILESLSPASIAWVSSVDASSTTIDFQIDIPLCQHTAEAHRQKRTAIAGGHDHGYVHRGSLATGCVTERCAVGCASARRHWRSGCAAPRASLRGRRRNAPLLRRAPTSPGPCALHGGVREPQRGGFVTEVRELSSGDPVEALEPARRSMSASAPLARTARSWAPSPSARRPSHGRMPTILERAGCVRPRSHSAPHRARRTRKSFAADVRGRLRDPRSERFANDRPVADSACWNRRMVRAPSAHPRLARSKLQPNVSIADCTTERPSRTRIRRCACGKNEKKRSRLRTLGDLVTSRRLRSLHRNETSPSPMPASSRSGRSGPNRAPPRIPDRAHCIAEGDQMIGLVEKQVLVHRLASATAVGVEQQKVPEKVRAAPRQDTVNEDGISSPDTGRAALVFSHFRCDHFRAGSQAARGVAGCSRRSQSPAAMLSPDRSMLRRRAPSRLPPLR